MAEEDHLHKFPRTRHLFDAGEDDVSREDLLFSEDEAQVCAICLCVYVCVCVFVCLSWPPSLSHTHPLPLPHSPSLFTPSLSLPSLTLPLQKLFLSGTHDVVIEEKIDGANIGFSIAEDGKVMAQNRSHFVNSATHPQFKHIDEWISSHIVC